MECIPGCGMCCLCQPEVLQNEIGYFRKEHPSALVRNGYPDDHYALALKKGHGSCVFLKDRRCSVYRKRPTYCRQFPYHFHVSDRIKVELDLSCRGVWTGNGIDAMEDIKPLVRDADRRLMDALREASRVYAEFYANCREAGVMSDISSIREGFRANIGNFTDLRYLGNVMEMSVEEPVMTLDSVTRKDVDLKELEDAAREAALGSMTSEDPLSVPVYSGRDHVWNLFMASGGRIEWRVLDDDGGIRQMGRADARDIPLKAPDAAGTEVMMDYLSILNQRDSMLGNVFHMMDSLGYEDDMANTYYGAMSVTILDIMWRTSMIDHFMGIGNGAEGMREGIMFYDMDRLDAPSIGAFV